MRGCATRRNSPPNAWFVSGSARNWLSARRSFGIRSRSFLLPEQRLPRLLELRLLLRRQARESALRDLVQQRINGFVQRLLRRRLPRHHLEFRFAAEDFPDPARHHREIRPGLQEPDICKGSRAYGKQRTEPRPIAIRQVIHAIQHDPREREPFHRDPVPEFEVRVERCECYKETDR